MSLRAPEHCRVRTGQMATNELNGNNGAFLVPSRSSGRMLTVIASDGAGWEHVSVSTKHRVPTYEEMKEIKQLFWDAEDTVVEYHPALSDFVNNHPYCLHLWRPTKEALPKPPAILVGFGAGTESGA
jgi:hypothetical protein